MKLLLTGASSYLGARLYTDLAHPFDVTGTYAAHQLSRKFIHLDGTDKNEVNSVISAIHPDVIIHAANNASAKWCEANPAQARRVNQESTQFIVTAANAIQAQVIYISSFSARDMSTVYGQTKSESEKIVNLTKAGYINLRSSLILGFSPNTTNDRPFNRILKNLDEGTPATYDTSWKFQATYLGHISEVISAVISKKIRNETISVASPELVSRFDIARDILSPFGKTVTPVDLQDQSSVLTDDQSKLKELGLPRYSYKEIIKKIVREIRKRQEFMI